LGRLFHGHVSMLTPRLGLLFHGVLARHIGNQCRRVLNAQQDQLCPKLISVVPSTGSWTVTYGGRGGGVEY
jgi:hypothetical protein